MMHWHGRTKTNIKKNIKRLFFLVLLSSQAQISALASDYASKELKAGEAWLLSIPASAPDILEVRNQGIDTLGITLDKSGIPISQSATWRGREGRYFIHITANALEVQLSSFEEFSGAGEVSINWLKVEDLDNSRASKMHALMQYAIGMDYHMTAHSSGDSDDHSKAIEAYKQALDQLEPEYHKSLIADIHYEIGVVYRHMGLLAKAKQHQQLAKIHFSSIADFKGFASSAVELGLVARGSGDKLLALRHYNDALTIRTKASDSFYAANILNNIGVVEWGSENYPSAIDAYSDALISYAGISLGSVHDVLQLSFEDITENGNLSEVINTLYNLSQVSMSAGDAGFSLNLWRVTLDLSERAGQSERVAQVRFGLGSSLISQGQLELGLRQLNAALNTFALKDDRVWISRVLMAIGDVYGNINEFDRALAYYRQSLEFSDTHQRQYAYALTQMATTNWALGRSGLALDQFAEAQSSFEDSSQLGSMAVVLSKKAMLSYELGYEQDALKSQREAIKIFETIDHPRELARAQSRYGQLLLSSDQDQQQAQQLLQKALEGHRAVGDELFELDTLTALSRAQTGVAALDAAKMATELADRIRMRTSSPGIQASFLASRRSAFEQYVDLLADSGDIEQAWVISEQIRARNLLDLIQTDSVGGKEANQTIEQRNSLLADLAAASKMGDNTALGNLRREIDLLNGQLRSTRSSDNLYAGLQTPLKLDVIQNQLGRNAAMLSYFVGEKRSHLWLINDAAIVHHELPGADDINSIANELTQVLRSHRQSPSRIAYIAGQLSNVVLAPVMDDIEGRDLVVVADGSLQLVPFALLPMSDDRSLALVDNSTVTYSPSAQIFNLLGDSLQLDPAAGIVVLADPLTTTNDQLALQNNSTTDQFAGPQIDFDNLLAQRSLSQSGVNIAALPGARLEAAAIEKAVHNPGVNQSEHSLKILTGAQANQQFVESGGLNGYGVIHFATHGVIDPDLPELSGLVLTQDTEHNEVSYLRPHQIAALNLDADLVVLSGCETGIGKSIGSEGSLSLSRPFLVAGAKQVVSSLWQVSDRATAVLMESFYHYLLNENQSPELALRSAQQRMREQSQWQHPYFWAGFVIQGGRNMPVEQSLPSVVSTTLGAKLAAGAAL